MCFNCRSKVRTRRPNRTRPATTDHDAGVDKLRSSSVICPPRRVHAAQRGSRTRFVARECRSPRLDRCLRRLVPASALVIALCQTIRLLKQQAGTEFGSLQRLDHHGAGTPWLNSAVDRDDVLARQPAPPCQINGDHLDASRTSHSSAWHWRHSTWSDPAPFVGIPSVDKLGLHRSRAV